MKVKLNLLTKLVLGIAIGIGIGLLHELRLVQLLATVNTVFGEFLKFCIPLILLGFITPGIANLEKSAGKILLLTAGIAYASTVLSGIFAFQINQWVFPKLLGAAHSLEAFENPEEGLVQGLFSIHIPPIVNVMSALLLAFLLGLGIATAENKTLRNWSNEFQTVVQYIINGFIIPILPIHIAGIFANMTYTGKILPILLVFFKVFGVIILLHLLVIIALFLIAGAVGRRSPIALLKNMLPAYFTAIGTQSSAATLPVTLSCCEKNKVSPQISSFVAPLCANIHMPGSTITLVSCSMAIMMMTDTTFETGSMLQFIFLLALTMIASPGVPGGSVMSALGLLQTVLGFNEALIGLMIALYLAQDSFGTACNVTTDGALAVIIDEFTLKNKKK